MKTITGIAWFALVLVATVPSESSAVCQTDSSAAQFAAGSGCYIGDDSGGEVLLSPTVGAEFDGNALPGTWGTRDWPYDGSTVNGTAIVNGGTVTLDGIGTWDPNDLGPGRSIEFVATFGAANFQHVGMAFYSGAPDNSPFNAPPWVMFSTGNDFSGGLKARVSGTGAHDEPVLCGGGSCLGSPHRYRIDWTATQTDFYIDGTLVYSSNVNTDNIQVTGLLRAAASDLDGGGATLNVDWLHVTPYTSPCAYESALIDSGGLASDWTTLSETITLPSSTGFSVSTRSGNTNVVDGTWSAYQPVSMGVIASPRARYLQYKVDLTTTDAGQTPELADVQVCYSPCTPSPEICDGQDNNCNDLVDEGNPGGGVSCNTNLPGVCAAGTTQCSGGTLVCNQNTPSSPEVCDGLDNDCDGTIDDGDPGGGAGCSTGHPGICAAGVRHCVAGSVQCVQTNTAHAETCNGLDDDCDGTVDDGDPGGGGACNTGNPGICAAGVDHCIAGSLQCVQTNTAHAETCNNLDDNCNGVVDEGNPGGGLSCNTGQSGVCAAGTTQCSAGSVVCNRNVAPSPEVCDGLDNNCNGSTDEGDPGGGGACSTGNPGICAAGVNHCQAGHIACVQTNSPAPSETCNGLDDNCNGLTDEGDPGGGGACNTGNPGICAAGVNHCTAGSVQCTQTNTPHTETCNNLDDNCNGVVDEGNPGGGASCNTGQQGVCSAGTVTCQTGSLTCLPNLAATPEVCNGLDDNCVGGVDEGNPGGGVPCSTGLPGVCAAGTTQCQSPNLVCVPNTPASTEICDTMLDEDCDGQVDEAPCELCTPANTVAVAAQTKISVLKLSSDKGKVVTKGTFVLPIPGLINPIASPVTLRIEDSVGIAYQATIPPNQFTGSSSGRSFRYSDVTVPYENGGLQGAKIKISGGDQTTTKYLFKARNLNLPTFVAGTGAVTVRIGNRCFQDAADTCTLSPSGSAAKCQ